MGFKALALNRGEWSVIPRCRPNPEIAQLEYSTYSLDVKCNNDNDNSDNDINDDDDNILGTFGQLRLRRDKLHLRGQM